MKSLHQNQHVLNFLVALVALALLATRASAASLSELLNGGFLLANNARFDAWQLLGLDDTGAPAPDLSLIQVTPLANDPANPGVQFAGGGQLAVAGLNALELELRYRVSAIGNSNSFVNQALAITNITFGGDGGIGYLSQETATVAGGDLGPAVVIADNESDISQFTDSKPIAPHLYLSVTLNVLLTGLDVADSINLAGWTQRFAHTGPPLLTGDFNGDKVIDGVDFLVWQRGQSPTLLSPQDLAAWRSNYGANVPTVAAASPVPEPAGAMLALIALSLRRLSPGLRPGVVRRKARR